MSTNLTAGLQCKGKAKRDSDGDVAIAVIWLALYLLMAVGALFAKRNESVVALAFFAAVLGGWGVLGWRRKTSVPRVTSATIALVLGLAMVASWSAPAGATTTTLNTIARGWYVDVDSFQKHDNHDPANDNYVTGQIGRSNYHNFFTFDLTGVTGTITSATLHLFEPSGTNFASGGFVTTQASETFQVFTYAGNISALDAGGQVPGVYNGLVSGTLAGSVSISAANGGTFVDVSLNAAALAALTGGEGGLFAFGGNLLGVPDGQLTQRTVFANSSVDDVGAPDGNTQLILTTPSTATPLPGALPLFVSGLGTFGFLGWRRKKKAALAA
jgi:hypothetical protein